jgi:hypothetical protein
LGNRDFQDIIIGEKPLVDLKNRETLPDEDRAWTEIIVEAWS